MEEIKSQVTIWLRLFWWIGFPFIMIPFIRERTRIKEILFVMLPKEAGPETERAKTVVKIYSYGCYFLQGPLLYTCLFLSIIIFLTPGNLFRTPFTFLGFALSSVIIFCLYLINWWRVQDDRSKSEVEIKKLLSERDDLAEFATKFRSISSVYDKALKHFANKPIDTGV